MRQFLPLTLLLTACSTQSQVIPPESIAGPAPMTLIEQMENAESAFKQTCLTALSADATSFVNRGTNSFEAPLRMVEHFSNYRSGLVAAHQAEQPTLAVANALGALLKNMSQPGLPDDIFMLEDLRNRLTTQIAEEDSFDDAVKLASIFSDRISEIISRELNNLYADLGVISLEVLDKVHQAGATEAAYIAGLRNKKQFLRDAVLKDMKEGLPPGWEPELELVAIEELLRTAEAEELTRAQSVLLLEQDFDRIGVMIKSLADSLLQG